MIEFDEFSCEDVDQYSSMYDAWDFKITQTTPGDFCFREERMHLPGVDVSWLSYRQPHEVLEFYQANGVCLTFPLGVERNMRHNDRETCSQSMIIQRPAEECSYSLAGNVSTFELQITNNLLGRSQLHNFAESMHTITLAKKQQLMDWCRLTAFYGRGVPDPDRALMLRDGILTRLYAILSPELEASEAGDSNRQKMPESRIVSAASRMVSSEKVNHPVKIGDIADKLGISERTIHRAFISQADIGPARYFELVRLHAIRRKLSSESNGNSPISELAERHGFSNAGRMARRYFEIFNEFPSQTAKRNRAHHPSVYTLPLCKH